MTAIRTSGWARRNDRLLEAVLGAAAAVAAAFGILIPLLGVLGVTAATHTREVGTATAARVADSVTGKTAVDGMTLTGGHRADLVLAHPGPGQRLLLALPELVGSLLLLLVLVLLLGMVRTLRDGDVLVPRNARRLSLIGLAALAQAVLAPVLPALTTRLLVRGTPLAAEIPFAVTFTGGLLLPALLLLALAEVFRRGTRLRADSAGPL
ncbi:DUF2975 domain-containing protein [Streptomyces sp. NPDC093260]|uniref:DUF2975 domain-containing protein n=1 Tax=Streptomyces sp. NPDC093260 TaxID=3155073 RepID=UPI00342C8D22